MEPLGSTGSSSGEYRGPKDPRLEGVLKLATTLERSTRNSVVAFPSANYFSPSILAPAEVEPAEVPSQRVGLSWRNPFPFSRSRPSPIVGGGVPRVRLPIDQPPHILFLPRWKSRPARKGLLLSDTPSKDPIFVENASRTVGPLCNPFIAGLVRGGFSFMQFVSATWVQLCNPR